MWELTLFNCRTLLSVKGPVRSACACATLLLPNRKQEIVKQTNELTFLGIALKQHGGQCRSRKKEFSFRFFYINSQPNFFPSIFRQSVTFDNKPLLSRSHCAWRLEREEKKKEEKKKIKSKIQKCATKTNEAKSLIQRPSRAGSIIYSYQQI